MKNLYITRQQFFNQIKFFEDNIVEAEKEAEAAKRKREFYKRMIDEFNNNNRIVILDSDKRLII